MTCGYSRAQTTCCVQLLHSSHRRRSTPSIGPHLPCTSYLNCSAPLGNFHWSLPSQPINILAPIYNLNWTNLGTCGNSNQLQPFDISLSTQLG
ncbi:hypothetical protein MJO28_016804 [Puccinia striiformis f. sp. tritici]|nr:hypothetical protein MJO28_016804 [Puccinia striiformis f. sp. tritici]